VGRGLAQAQASHPRSLAPISRDARQFGLSNLDMHARLRFTQGKMPDEVQLELLAPWYTQDTSESRTLDLFDAIPKYPFAVTTAIPKPERLEVPFTLHGQRYTAFVAPAQITDARTGQERLVFPGSREELVERALRFIAVQQIARTRLTPDTQTGRQAVTVFFTLSMIRRHLEEIGHGYKLNEIKEALDILSDTSIEVRLDSDAEVVQSKRRRFMKGTILSNYTGDFAEGDRTGEDSRAAMTFHPLATQAILGLAFYPINQLRVGKLKRPLARWLTTRMSHNYRQARKNGFVQQEGYHISLQTILEERGLSREARLWNNLKSVREALTEMKKARILSEMQSFDEKPIHAPSKGRPKIVDAIWTLYPSGEFVDEIIGGNKHMKQAANNQQSQLLPGFRDQSGRWK
jgi:hypothetical protein